MKLKDVYYFSIKKHKHPPVFNLAQKVVAASETNQQDSEEIQRRLSLLTTSTGNEHLRQCANFIAEAVAFNELLEQGKDPHWVSENSNPTPDIQYVAGNGQTPVEVKHLNNPHDEHEALASGQMLGEFINPNYDVGISQKINDFFSSAKRKFVAHNKQVNNIDSDAGILYLFFSKSIDADLADGIPWQIKMEDRVKAIAGPLVGDNITLIVKDLNASI